MDTAKIVLLLCFVATAYGQVSDDPSVVALNPLDVRTVRESQLEVLKISDEIAVKDPKSVPVVVVGICMVYEFAKEANVTHEQVAEFILEKTPVKYRSRLYDEFIRGGTDFVAKLAKVGCTFTKIKNLVLKLWPSGHHHQILQTLAKPFAGLVNSEEVEIVNDAIEYIETHRGEKNLQLIPETFCFVHNNSYGRGVTKEGIIEEVEKKMPVALRKKLIEHILRGTVDGVARIAEVGCKVLPLHVEYDASDVDDSEDLEVLQTSHEVVVKNEKAVPAVLVGICMVYEFATEANVTHEQVADFILKHTPAKIRTRLYEEFIEGGTEFVARLANVGCTLLKIKNLVEKLWPFGHHHLNLQTLAKPFAGLVTSIDVKIMHEAIEYISDHRGDKNLNMIPQTFCYVQESSSDRYVTKQEIIAQVEKRMPGSLRKTLVDHILIHGLDGVAKLADVGCKVLTVHVEVDIKKADVSDVDVNDNQDNEVTVASQEVAGKEKKNVPAVVVGICMVYEFAKQSNVTHEQVAEFILEKTPVKYRSRLYDEFIRGGSDFLARLANVGCTLTKIKNLVLRMWPFAHHRQILQTLAKPFAGLVNSEEIEIVNDAIEYIGAHRGESNLFLIPETFCYVRDNSYARGVTKEGIIEEVEKKMPVALRKKLVDHILRGTVDGVARIAEVGCKVLPLHVEIDIKKIKVSGVDVE